MALVSRLGTVYHVWSPLASTGRGKRGCEAEWPSSRPKLDRPAVTYFPVRRWGPSRRLPRRPPESCSPIRCLPAGLTFESAAPPPSATEPFLTWQEGGLAERSGPFTIVLYARAAPDLPVGTLLVNKVALRGTPEELETLNNQALAEMRIGRAAFVPLVGRAY